MAGSNLPSADLTTALTALAAAGLKPTEVKITANMTSILFYERPVLGRPATSETRSDEQLDIEDEISRHFGAK